jgi:tetratricopeptide (TPR) repeat protein
MGMRLPSTWKLPDAIKIRFGEKRSGKQRTMVADGHVLLVLHKVPTHEMDEREAAFFWRKPNGEWESTERGQGLFTLRQHIESFEQAEEAFDAALRKAQHAEDYFQILQDLAPVSHAAKNLHATLQAAREAVHEDRDIIDLRDQAYDLQRTLELLYTDTRTALDFYMARKSEEQTRLGMESIQSENRLNILAAIFFPITAIAGIFGMNLRSGLENLPIVGFWLIFAAGILLGFITRGWVKAKS